MEAAPISPNGQTNPALLFLDVESENHTLPLRTTSISEASAVEARMLQVGLDENWAFLLLKENMELKAALAEAQAELRELRREQRESSLSSPPPFTLMVSTDRRCLGGHGAQETEALGGWC